MKIKKGFALIFTLLTTLIIMAIIISFTAISSNDLTLAKKTSDTIRAYYLAEAGLAKKFVDLRGGSTSGTSGSIALSTNNPGTFSVTVNQVVGGLFPSYTLTSTGTYKNVRKTLILTVRQISYSRFIYLTNSEMMGGNTPVWFIGGDIIRGPVHTNGQINISNNPTFEGPVSSVSTTIDYYHGPPPLDNPDFQESLTLGAPNIKLPTNADMITNLSTAAQQTGGLYLTGNSTVTLLSNGTMKVTNSAKHWNNHTLQIPQNGALFVNNGDLDISGILSGQLTVGTDSNVYIVNSLLYANDPRTHPSSTDTLGIVSQNNVFVDANAPTNVEIDGYIVALNTSFSVENYTSGLKGTLTLYGGITQLTRGAVGTFNSSTGKKASGYTKDYNYDPRFENTAPEYFPPAKDTNSRIVYLKTLWAEL